MAVRSGFFNAKQSGSGWDRTYDALDLSSIFDGIIQDGVFQNYAEGLVVRPGTGLKTVVNTGRAWFNHTWTLNDSDFVLVHNDPDTTYSRIDLVVLEVNTNESVRANEIKVITGTPSGAPRNPDLINNDMVHQYALASVLIRPKATSITAADVTDLRGTEQTPYAQGVTINPDISQALEHWAQTFQNALEDDRKAFQEFMDTATGNPGLAVPISETEIDNMFAAR